MTAPEIICQEPRPGETRDCLDPWKMSFVHADGGVSLCCWSRSIGSINAATVNEILEGDAAKAMRRGLLTGRVPVDCVRCPSRSLVPVGDFKKKVEEFLSGDDRKERMDLRARTYALHEQVASQRRHIEAVEADRAKVQQHAHNLEIEREHLKMHNEMLLEKVNSIHEGRANIFHLIVSWTRGLVRRKLRGGARPPAAPAD
ncbi:MAG: SPASM domain-containing protein [Planctomycetota bacterium]|jgi:hypothetical protein